MVTINRTRKDVDTLLCLFLCLLPTLPRSGQLSTNHTHSSGSASTIRENQMWHGVREVPVEHGIPESRDEGVGLARLSEASACAVWLLETSSGLMQTESKSQGLICWGSGAWLHSSCQCRVTREVSLWTIRMHCAQDQMVSKARAYGRDYAAESWETARPTREDTAMWEIQPGRLPWHHADHW